jgi:hypothetical protein
LILILLIAHTDGQLLLAITLVIHSNGDLLARS